MLYDGSKIKPIGWKLFNMNFTKNNEIKISGNNSNIALSKDLLLEINYPKEPLLYDICTYINN